jgi:hypothetical protein
MRKLKALDLRGCKIADGGIQEIAASSKLREVVALWVDDNEITDVGLRQLAASIGLPNLSTLTLYMNQITNRGAEALAYSGTMSRLRRVALGWDVDPERAPNFQARFGQANSTFPNWRTIFHPSSMVTRPSIGGIGVEL